MYELKILVSVNELWSFFKNNVSIGNMQSVIKIFGIKR